MPIIRELLEPLLKIMTLKYFEPTSAMHEEIVVTWSFRSPSVRTVESPWDISWGPVACCSLRILCKQLNRFTIHINLHGEQEKKIGLGFL
jgi:RNAse (barnase) inhibitor barstar